MKNRQIDKMNTKQIRIDAELHHLIKIKAAKVKQSIKSLVEGILIELLEIKTDE